ncbi:MAG: M23 family metallopeptidase [Oscillospiraceae bacterium]
MVFHRNSDEPSGKSRRFSGLTKRAKITALASLTSFCAALVIATVFCSSFICYAVSYDGTALGEVSSRSELIEAIEAAETVASGILGEELSIASSVTVTAGLGTAGGSSDQLTDMLLENVDGIVRKYAITVDGSAVGTLDSSDELSDILDSILDEYSNKDTVSAGFAQDVSVDYIFISEELESDPEKIAQLLSPENSQSPYSLTVLTSDISEVVEAVEYTTEYEFDDEKYSDEEELLQTGKDGAMSVTYLTRRSNGEELSSVVTGSYVLADAIPEKILVGTKPGSRSDSTGTYIWPAEGTLSSDFGYRSVAVGSSNHKGIDIASSSGTPIYAADGGTVIFAQYWTGSGYGNLIEIEHDNGDITYYGHLSSISVSEGDKVAQGDLIGEMGATGNVSGTHLHFEIRPGGGEPANPLNYLPER